MPDDMYDARRVIDPLPVRWDAEPHAPQRQAGRGLGCQLQRRSPRRPSVIIPGERNVLINPKHADGARRALVGETVPL